MSVKTTRIAHLSDLHLLDPHPDGSRSYGFDVRFVSLGRKLDARARMRKVSRALEAAHRAGVDHVVVSGDLTETGTPQQFEPMQGMQERPGRLAALREVQRGAEEERPAKAR